MQGATVVTTAVRTQVRPIAQEHEHELVDVEIKLAKLPKALDGFSIVQLSDLHVGPTIDRHFVRLVVERANGLAPDLVALTGDFADGPVARYAPEAAPLAELRAK